MILREICLPTIGELHGVEPDEQGCGDAAEAPCFDAGNGRA